MFSQSTFCVYTYRGLPGKWRRAKPLLPGLGVSQDLYWNMEFIFALGIGINFFTLLQLFRSKRWHVQSNAIAIAIVALWLFRFVFSYLKTQDIALEYPIVSIFDQYLFFLDGVLFWLYAKSLWLKLQFSLKIALHFIPFLLGMTLVFTEILLYPKEVLLQEIQNTQEAFIRNELSVTPEVFVFICLVILVSVIYFLKSLHEIRQYNQVVFANFSTITHLSASWLVTFLRLWMLLFLMPLLVYFLNYIHPIIDLQFSGYFLLPLLLLFSLLFNLNVVTQYYLPESMYKKGTDKSMALPKEVLEVQLQKVKNALAEEKYYEDENLSLQKLAAYLEMKPVDLTELIKNSEYKNFYDLINSYRIEAIKAALIATKEQIMILAYNNGFNSKSAFNRIFKENTGQTPSEFRKSHK